MSPSFDADRFFDEFANARKQASVDAVFGAPIESSGRTVIPIGSAMYGFGLGAGVDEKEAQSDFGGGGGGGYVVHPIALAVIDQDGVSIKPVVNEGRIALAGILTGAWSVFWIGRVLLRLVSRLGGEKRS
jgi:uncharacterized spore protein YtfJ